MPGEEKAQRLILGGVGGHSPGERAQKRRQSSFGKLGWSDFGSKLWGVIRDDLVWAQELKGPG